MARQIVKLENCVDCKNELTKIGKPCKDGKIRCKECIRIMRANESKKETFDRIQNNPNNRKCPFCDIKFSRMRYGLEHLKKEHPDKTEKEFKYWIYTGQGDPIFCACGECDIEIDVNKFWSNPHEPKYMAGHNTKIHNNWGHNPVARENSNKSIRENFASGERSSKSSAYSR